MSTLLAVGVLLPLAACGGPSERIYEGAYSYICGTRIGMEASVFGVSPTAPRVLEDVTAGGVVPLQVAPCSEGVDVELSPATGSGAVIQIITDSELRTVGLVIRPVPGRVLRAYETTSRVCALVATIDISKPG